MDLVWISRQSFDHISMPRLVRVMRWKASPTQQQPAIFVQTFVRRQSNPRKGVPEHIFRWV